jgi:hypothetical protein
MDKDHEERLVKAFVKHPQLLDSFSSPEKVGELLGDGQKDAVYLTSFQKKKAGMPPEVILNSVQALQDGYYDEAIKSAPAIMSEEEWKNIMITVLTGANSISNGLLIKATAQLVYLTFQPIVLEAQNSLRKSEAAAENARKSNADRNAVHAFIVNECQKPIYHNKSYRQAAKIIFPLAQDFAIKHGCRPFSGDTGPDTVYRKVCKIRAWVR